MSTVESVVHVTIPDTVYLEGTFEYIEAKIRHDAEGMAFGGDFEWLCQWFLKNAPRYRGQFEKVWLWKDWPDRWGPDAGIDIVARTRAGELWAIQAKADHPERAIKKREIDSFLSESNRPQFAYRLLMATTDDIGVTARRTVHGQEKPVGLLLRGHLLTEEVKWPLKIGGGAERLPTWKARPHQEIAIQAAVNGFGENDRGRLIMACGTGKTLTALWIAERLQSRLTLVLVPSLSLVQQNLAEWGRHAAADFDTLVVCSDESVLQSKADSAVQSAADIGVKVTTKPEEIRHFLGQRRKRPAVVFATYQSSDRIATAQAGRTKPFDLAICDEAHRLAGNAEGLFATVLNGKKIKARKRLFMTATPRYFKENAKQRAAEMEFELVSMDDQHVFGPEFHVLTFHQAISAKPPLLTDYQVVVIGVTDREAKALAEEARLIHTVDGLSTDARTLAAQIGLAKAMKKYDLRKIITFHSSVAKAARFVDASARDSLPGVIPHLTRPAKPTGKLWTKHISGHTPAGQRATLLNGLGNLPNDTRGILSNCACLGEGVDVPVLDGVAFIDPKRSMVDIIQAVGRVIRKAEGKETGTIVIPVFIDESEDADQVLTQSAFDPVWQVLKALRAHDRRLADELDQLRLSLGNRTKSSGRINLPDNIRLDVPRLQLHDFEQAFYVRTVEQTTDKPSLTVEQILAWADEHKKRTGDWPNKGSGRLVSCNDSWASINAALRNGSRGLIGGATLAGLLNEHRGVRNTMTLEDVSIEQILRWADAHKASTGKWPKSSIGQILGTDETWLGIDAALRKGARGFQGGSSLATLLAEQRGVRNHMDLSSLSIDQIIKWADEHKKRTGNWPNKESGSVSGSDETWSGINNALNKGGRGLLGSTSLSALLKERRGVRNNKDLSSFTYERILGWADEHKRRTGNWPNKGSGRLWKTDETWSRINDALNRGLRGLSGGSSLAKLLVEQRGIRDLNNLPQYTINKILAWVDEYQAKTGEWPTKLSGKVIGTNETWLGVTVALTQGQRGLSGGSSLPKLLAEHRGVRHLKDLPPLTYDQILKWSDEHKKRTGNWPNQNTGKLIGTNETVASINGALRMGTRGLPGGSSLPKLLDEHRGVRNPKDLQPLTYEQIVKWADEHKLRTNKWPKMSSGQVLGTDETWLGIDNSLRRGSRGLPERSSLPNLLATHRNVRNPKDLPRLTYEQILKWAKEHKKRTGNWPNRAFGNVPETDEKWPAIEQALSKGVRGLPGDSSLSKLLGKQRGK